MNRKAGNKRPPPSYVDGEFRDPAIKEAQKQLRDPNLLGALMVRLGHADALIGGLTQHYPDTIRPSLQVIELRPGVRKVAGCYVLITQAGDLFFLADATVNIEPTAEDLAEIALLTADTARRFDVEPRVAMLSFSNFGSARHPLSDKVRQAVRCRKRGGRCRPPRFHAGSGGVGWGLFPVRRRRRIRSRLLRVACLHLGLVLGRVQARRPRQSTTLSTDPTSRLPVAAPVARRLAAGMGSRTALSRIAAGRMGSTALEK